VLSVSHRFLFIHIPKTGGNSVQNVLRAYSEDDIVRLNPLQDGLERFEVRNARYPYHKHSSLAEYQSLLDPSLFADLYKFCCVRNPWDRLISFYFSPHRRVTEWSRDEFARLVADTPPMIAHLGDAGGDEAPTRTSPAVNYVMRFERLQEDFDEVCRRLGIARGPLPHRNRSRRGHYSEYYDSELRDLVAEHHAPDIECFGYRFEGR
jgi:hypothetical protein